MDLQAASACLPLTTPPTTTAVSLRVTRQAVPVPAAPAGRQRMRHTPDAAAPTCIIPDEEPLPLPPEVQNGLAHVACLGWHQLDAFALAAQAQMLFARAAPKVRVLQCPGCTGCPRAAAFCVPCVALDAVMPQPTHGSDWCHTTGAPLRRTSAGAAPMCVSMMHSFSFCMSSCPAALTPATYHPKHVLYFFICMAEAYQGDLLAHPC